jgi:hypothetical protein
MEEAEIEVNEMDRDKDKGWDTSVIESLSELEHP